MRQTEMIEWVPVAEGLPERCNWYLATNVFGGIGMYLMNAYGKFEYDNCEPVNPGTLIAWATLPEPYREVQHEQGSDAGRGAGAR